MQVKVNVTSRKNVTLKIKPRKVEGFSRREVINKIAGDRVVTCSAGSFYLGNLIERSKKDSTRRVYSIEKHRAKRERCPKTGKMMTTKPAKWFGHYYDVPSDMPFKVIQKSSHFVIEV